MIARIATLETWREDHTAEHVRDRATQAQTNLDHEKRLRAVEKTVWKASGALSLLMVILKFVKL